MRYYPWVVIEKWLASIMMGTFHSLVTAPGIRMSWLTLLLFLSRFTSCFDCCLVMQPALTTFEALAKPSSRRENNGDDSDEDSEQSDHEEISQTTNFHSEQSEDMPAVER